MERSPLFFVTSTVLLGGLWALLISCHELMTDFERGGPGPDPDLPQVSTTVIKQIAGDSALGDGEVVAPGASPVTERGICWNTYGNPTLADSSAANGRGVGVFINTAISKTKPNTIYYARAYATNTQGTSYGKEIAFDSGYVFGTFRRGGLVYLNDGNGGGWVVETGDSLAQRAWSNIADVEIGTTGELMGTGATNTELIISQSGHTTSPALECANLDSSGYDDWYLPSLGTVRALYLWLHVKSLGNFKYNRYWSSTEVSAVNAYGMSFGLAQKIEVPKTDTLPWRCVRFAREL